MIKILIKLKIRILRKKLKITIVIARKNKIQRTIILNKNKIILIKKIQMYKKNKDFEIKNKKIWPKIKNINKDKARIMIELIFGKNKTF